MTPAPTAASFALFDTAFGVGGLAWSAAGLVATRLPESDTARLKAWFTRRGMTETEPAGETAAAVAAIRALLATGRGDLSAIRCDFGSADTLTIKVYTLTRRIPPGAVTTYGELAAEAGDRALARYVGQVMAKNPLPVVVPCHRVLGAGGAMTGFSAEGGVDLKRRLLALEGAPEAGFAF